MSKWTSLPLSDFPVGSLKRITSNGHAICVARTHDGLVYAIADECTHEQYSLAEGELIGHELECPQHTSRFDLRTGKPTGLPAVVPARVFNVRIEEDRVQIEL